jgi:hypothetical protein
MGGDALKLTVGTLESHAQSVESDWPAWPSGDDREVDGHLDAIFAPASGPLSWNSVKSNEARPHWSALREWVEWFRYTFALDHRVVPPCWYRHPALVEVLSALRDHRVCAYGPTNPALGASDWHRALMQLEPRLRDWAARTGCTTSVHRPDVLAEYPDDADAWEQHITTDVAARVRRERVGDLRGQQALPIGLDDDDVDHD